MLRPKQVTPHIPVIALIFLFLFLHNLYDTPVSLFLNVLYLASYESYEAMK